MVNGVEKIDNLSSEGGEYQLLNVFGIYTVQAIFSGIDNPDGLASVDVTPKSITTFAGEPVQFTAKALNNLNKPANNTTYAWSCTPTTAGSFDDATSVTPIFTPAIAESIDITCIATQGSVEQENTVTIVPTALTSLAIAPDPQFFNGIYFQPEAAAITFNVIANGTAITRATFLNALVLDEGLVIQDGKLVCTPSGTGSIPVSVSIGSVKATSNLTVYPTGVDFVDKTGMTATASSYDAGRGLTPDLALDGDVATRWAGSPTGLNGGNKNQEEWLLIDLGMSYKLDMIQIDWESAKSEVYEIWVSDKADGTYTKVGEEINASVSTDHLIVRTLLKNSSGDDVVAQFVKILCEQRTNDSWNYSIYEVNMIGTSAIIIGLNSVSATDGKVIKTEYYNLQGVRVIEPVEKGIYIVKKTYDTGKVSVSKLIKTSNNNIIK